MANVVLVDDHEIIIDSLKYLIEDQSGHIITAKFNNAEDALDYIKGNHEEVDIIVSDIKLPAMNGIELTRRIKEVDYTLKVILLSQFSSREFVVNGIRNGANGYLLKSTDGNELIKAIDTVVGGQQYLCDVSTQVLIMATSDPKDTLSEREMEVLKYIAMGLSGREIAEKLYVQTATIDFHKKNIKTKLGVTKITDLTRIAIEMGIVD